MCAPAASAGRRTDYRKRQALRGEGRLRLQERADHPRSPPASSRARACLSGEGDVAPTRAGGRSHVVLTAPPTRGSLARETTRRAPRSPVSHAGARRDVSVPTLDGEEKVVSRPGTVGSELRLKGGDGTPRPHGRGDLLVRVSVRVPEAPRKSRKELLRTYAELTGAPVGGSKGVFRKAKKIFSEAEPGATGRG